MKNVKFVEILDEDFADETLLGLIHYLSYNDDYSLCGSDISQTFEYEYTSDNVTCKHCINALNYYKKLGVDE